MTYTCETAAGALCRNAEPGGVLHVQPGDSLLQFGVRRTAFTLGIHAMFHQMPCYRTRPETQCRLSITFV